MAALDWSPLWLTLQLAAATTCLLLFIGVPLAAWLAYTTKRGLKAILETLVAMPLVLPPTVLGFYLLLAFSPQNAFGLWLDNWLGLRLIFSFPGLVLASCLYSLPFMVQPIQAGLASLPASYREAAYVLGKSPWQTFWRVTLPNIKPALLTGIVLAFAHTIGEFGVVLMIGGNIPGQTRVASIAIYDAVESMNYPLANAYALALIGICFSILLLVYLLNGNYFKANAHD